MRFLVIALLALLLGLLIFTLIKDEPKHVVFPQTPTIEQLADEAKYPRRWSCCGE